MALKKITAPIVETAKTTGDDMPTFRLPGDVVTRYNKASADAKDADARLKAARLPLATAGLNHFLNARCGGQDISSIKLVDDNAAVVRYTFQDRYSAADAEPVDRVMEDLGADINDWVAETVKASFDSGFFTTADGEFDQKAYDETVKALEVVCKKLGKANPLSCKKVVQPKPTFHAKRFVEFDAAANKRLTEVLPNTQTLTPVAAKA